MSAIEVSLDSGPDDFLTAYAWEAHPGEEVLHASGVGNALVVLRDDETEPAKESQYGLGKRSEKSGSQRAAKINLMNARRAKND